MILDMNKKSDIPLMMRYGKAKGTLLLNRYLPSLSQFNNIYIIDSEEEWDKIKDTIPDRLLFRADAPIGDQPVFIPGANGDKAEIPEFIQKIKQQNQNGVLIVFDSKKEPALRYTLNGGFNIGISLGQSALIEFVGKGFDGRELTKGIACHESFKIPWNEIIFCNNSRKMQKFRVHTTSDEEYKASIEERVKFFKGINIPEELVRASIPARYKGISGDVIDNILETIVFPLYQQSRELSYDNLGEFAIAGNIDGENLIPFEIYRPERILQRNQGNTER